MNFLKMIILFFLPLFFSCSDDKNIIHQINRTGKKTSENIQKLEKSSIELSKKTTEFSNWAEKFRDTTLNKISDSTKNL